MKFKGVCEIESCRILVPRKRSGRLLGSGRKHGSYVPQILQPLSASFSLSLRGGEGEKILEITSQPLPLRRECWDRRSPRGRCRAVARSPPRRRPFPRRENVKNTRPCRPILVECISAILFVSTDVWLPGFDFLSAVRPQSQSSQDASAFERCPT